MLFIEIAQPNYKRSIIQFRWSWEDWDEALSQDPEQPKAKFIREVLLKCLRLSYHQRVMDIVPETFAGFVPDKPTPNYKYSLEGPLAGSPQARTSTNVVNAIKRKCSAEEVLLVLKVSRGLVRFLSIRCAEPCSV